MAVAGGGEPAAIGRKGQRANAAAVGFDVALLRAVVDIPHANQSVATGHGHPRAVGRERDGAHVSAGTHELLADLARRCVDDLEAVAETNEGELVTIRMKTHGGNRIFASRQLENVVVLVDIPHADRAIAAAGGDGVSVLRKNDRADPIAVSFEVIF